MEKLKSTEKYFMNSDRICFSLWSKDNTIEAKQLWGDPKVTKYIVASGIMTETDISNRLDKEIDTYEKYNICYWPIFLKDTAEFMGCCGLRPFNVDDHVFELGVHLLPKFWGEGYGKEACLKVIGYTFDELKCNTIFAGHNPNNCISAKLLGKIGFVFSHNEYYAPTGLSHPSYFLNK